jgi:hypothetical protein
LGEAEIRRIAVQGQLRQIVCETPISKITKANWTGNVVHAVEPLLCICKALSYPSPTKKWWLEGPFGMEYTSTLNIPEHEKIMKTKGLIINPYGD